MTLTRNQREKLVLFAGLTGVLLILALVFYGWVHLGQQAAPSTPLSETLLLATVGTFVIPVIAAAVAAIVVLLPAYVGEWWINRAPEEAPATT